MCSRRSIPSQDCRVVAETQKLRCLLEAILEATPPFIFCFIRHLPRPTFSHSMAQPSTGFAISLADVKAAATNIDGVATRTPVMTSRFMDDLSGRSLFFKCELFQRGGAFKFRGAVCAPINAFTPSSQITLRAVRQGAHHLCTLRLSAPHSAVQRHRSSRSCCRDDCDAQLRQPRASSCAGGAGGWEERAYCDAV